MPERSFFREIPTSVRERFESVLSLPEEKLRVINSFAKEHLQDLRTGEVESFEPGLVADEIGVSRVDLLAALSLVGTALLRPSPSMEAYIAELKATIGDVALSARLLLDGISASPEEAEYLRQREIARQSVLPTLEGADAIVDLRAIFRKFPSPSVSAPHEKQVKTFLRFEPVVLISLDLNDAVGNDNACAFQLTENGLRHLLKTLQEASAQLDIVKEKQRMLDSGEARNA